MAENIHAPIQNLPRKSVGWMWKLMLWILFSGFILLLFSIKSSHAIPLLFAVLLAVLLFRIRRKFVSGWSPTLRTLSWVFVIVVSYAIYVVLWYQLGTLRVLLLDYSLKRAEKATLELLAKDKYGGKTPQETYEMYLDALRKGDIELASKYFVPSEQGDVKDFLESLKKLGSFENWVAARLPSESCVEVEKNSWPEYIKIYECGVVLKEPIIVPYSGPGDSTTTIVQSGTWKSRYEFSLNKEAGIWKIGLL